MRLALALFALLLCPALAQAVPDASVGKKLVAERNCETCHNNKTMGDAKAVYLRKDRKVTSNTRGVTSTATTRDLMAGYSAAPALVAHARARPRSVRTIYARPGFPSTPTSFGRLSRGDARVCLSRRYRVMTSHTGSPFAPSATGAQPATL
jgi:hypothetical protein